MSNQPANDIELPKKRGRPKGLWGNKAWRDAVVRAALRRDPVTKQRYLDMAADQLVRQAVLGDAASMKEMGDRLDGRVNQGQAEGQARVSFVVHMPAPMAAEAWGAMAQQHAPVPIEHASQATIMERVRDMTNANGSEQANGAYHVGAHAHMDGDADASAHQRTVTDVVELPQRMEVGGTLGGKDDQEPR